MTTTMTTATMGGAAAATERCADGAAGVRPLLSAGRRVTVDGHPICAVCGGAVEPVGPDQWRHGLSRRPRITPEAQDYAAFTRRFPRSEERRVGKECRAGVSPVHQKNEPTYT